LNKNHLLLHHLRKSFTNKIIYFCVWTMNIFNYKYAMIITYVHIGGKLWVSCMCTLRYDAVDQPYSNIYLIELSESYSSVSQESHSCPNFREAFGSVYEVQLVTAVNLHNNLVSCYRFCQKLLASMVFAYPFRIFVLFNALMITDFTGKLLFYCKSLT
jgi:hypothetical protein